MPKCTPLLALVAGSLAAVSCGDAAFGTDGEVGDRIGRLGAVEAIVRQEALPDGALQFTLIVRSGSAALSAFQGSLAFAPGAFTLVSVASPPNANNESVLVNSGTFAAGTIRFAAFTPTSFGSANSADGVEVMRVTVRALRPIAPTDVGAVLEVVAGPDGRAPRASDGSATQ